MAIRSLLLDLMVTRLDRLGLPSVMQMRERMQLIVRPSGVPLYKNARVETSQRSEFEWAKHVLYELRMDPCTSV